MGKDPNHNKKDNQMQNKLIDLNNHLFAQLERLSDEETAGDKLSEEVGRARAIGHVAQSIIENARLALDAQKALGTSCNNLPQMIGIEK